MSSQNLRPWVSWNNVHMYWSRVDSYGAEHALGTASLSVFGFLPRWGAPFMCTVAFLFFAVGDDAMRKYYQWARSASRLVTKQGPETADR